MAFKGFDEDGTPLYDSREAAIERAKQMRAYSDHPENFKIKERRSWAPYWFGRLVQGTVFDFLAYKEIVD